MLFRSMEIYNEWRKKIKTISEKSVLFNKLKVNIPKLEEYSKSFLKRYATELKLDAASVLETIPDDWSMINIAGDEEDESLMDYLMMTFNDRVGKEINTKIIKRVREVEKLNVDSTLIKLQRAYIMMRAENICKICKKKLISARSFYVFPNGIVTHTNCAKDLQTCPLTKIKFNEKVYI